MTWRTAKAGLAADSAPHVRTALDRLLAVAQRAWQFGRTRLERDVTQAPCEGASARHSDFQELLGRYLWYTLMWDLK